MNVRPWLGKGMNRQEIDKRMCENTSEFSACIARSDAVMLKNINRDFA